MDRRGELAEASRPALGVDEERYDAHGLFFSRFVADVSGHESTEVLTFRVIGELDVTWRLVGPEHRVPQGVGFGGRDCPDGHGLSAWSGHRVGDGSVRESILLLDPMFSRG